MRKRILCTALLSLVALWAMALPALAAAAKDYFKINSIATDTKSKTFDTYADDNTLPTITLTAKAGYKSATEKPSGYTETKTITWTVDVDPKMKGKTAPSIKAGTAFSATSLTTTATLTGSVKGTCTLTVTATMGDLKKTLTINVKVQDKPAPKISAGNDAAKFIGQAGSALTLKASNGTVTGGTAIANNKITFNSYPEYIEITPDATTLTSYGVTVTKSGTDGTALADATKTRDVTFSSTANNVNKTTDGLKITVAAYNKKADGSDGTKVTQDVTLIVEAIKPAAWTTEAGGKKADIGSLAASKGEAKDNITLIKTGAAVGNAIKWELQNITTPTTFTAEGLPPGITLEPIDATNKTNAAAVKGKQATKFGVMLSGTPTTPGYYDKIYITAKNAGGEIKGGPYTLDVVNEPKITVDSIPDITWGQNYSYTIPAEGGENTKHPLTYTIKAGSKTPGLKLTNTTKGILAGRFESCDEAATDFALGSATEKEFSTLTLTVKNDYVKAAVEKTVKFKLKGVKPVLVNSAATAQNELNKGEFKALNAVEWKGGATIYPIIVNGPGEMTFTYDNLPAGITATDKETDKTKSQIKITFEGEPEVTAKNHVATVTVSNALGSQKIPLKFNIGADSADFKITPNKGAIAPIKVDGKTAITNTAFEAAFGPVTWRAKNLPAGLKLSVDKSVPGDKKVWVTGTPTAATKADKNGQSIYEITAVNKDIPNVSRPYEATVSQDFRLFKKPTISTKSLPAITLEKAYTGKITGSGASSSDLSWLVTIAEVPAGTATALPATKGVVDTGSTKNFKPSATPAGKYTLTVSSDAKTGMPLIVGSLDRIPASGRLKVTAKATVAKGTSVAQDSDPVEMIVQVKGTAARVTTSSAGRLKKKDTTSSSDVIATGTLPIYMKALVSETDVQKLLNFDTVEAAVSALGVGSYTDANSKKYIDLTNKPTNKLGINFVYDATKLDGKGKLQSIASGTYTVTNLPVRIQAANAVTLNNSTGKVELRSSDKVLKVTVTGDAPEWKRGSKVASPDITIFETDGTAITDVTYTVSADLPYTITVSPSDTVDKPKNGLTATVTQATGTTPGKVVISGTPEAEKETKTTFTLTVMNPTSKQKSQAKVTIVGQMRPEITTKIDSEGYLAEKVTEVGKTLSYKVNAKGSKRAYLKTSPDTKPFVKELATNMVAYAPIVWTIEDAAAVSKLEAIGLEFDTDTGAFKGMPIGTTSADKAYEPLEFTIKPKNTATGDADKKYEAKVKIGVKGKKPKLTTKTITLVRGNESYDVADCQLNTNLSDDKSAYIKWKWANTDYVTWGFDGEISSNGNLGKLAGSDLPTATKGVNLRVTAENLGQEVTGNVKFIIRDKDPEITTDDDEITLAGEKDVAVTEDIEFTLSDAAAMMTGDTKIEWKIGAQPSVATVKVSAPRVNSDGTGCTVTLTAVKGIKTNINGAKFSVTAKNRSTGAMATKEITVNVTAYSEALPAEKDAAPEDKAALPESETAEEETLTEEEEELAAGEGTVTYGKARAESGLTQAERKALAEGGYVIAAILPEITTDASGQYDLDVVSLDEAATEGAELVWFAFPRNAESTEDDSIAEFYDEAGAEIYAVPESKKVVVSPWLEAEVTYAPVIAVKAPLAGDAKTSLDDAEAGDTVTEQAIEDAIETPEEK